jgi:hypothetical protein
VQKKIIVLDSSAVVAAVFWNGDARRCMTAEVRRKAESPIDPGPILDWLEAIARKVEPIIFLSRLSRDKNDSVFIGCALAANAQFIATHDPDLLVLKKPFGIKILRPREFLRKISK